MTAKNDFESSSHILKQTIKCANFAAMKHRDQRRKDPEGTPYINHPLGVAHILTEEAGITDLAVIQAALLHDTVEDTETTFDELRSTFGDEVTGIKNILPQLTKQHIVLKVILNIVGSFQSLCLSQGKPKFKTGWPESDPAALTELSDIVSEVTDDKALPKLERKRLQIEHARHASYKAKLVKLADKLYNLRDLQRTTPQGWSESRVVEYFEWSAKVVAGIRGTNQIMENSIDELFKSRGVIEYTY